MTSVAVAVNGGDGNGSRRAVNWAVKTLLPTADRFVLLHVMSRITSIPTPCKTNSLLSQTLSTCQLLIRYLVLLLWSAAAGDIIPVAELDEGVVATYVKDMIKDKYEEVFTVFRKLLKSNKVEALVVEDDVIANGIVSFVSQSDISCLVLGSSSSNYITRKLKGPDVPTLILKCAPESCDIHVVSKRRVVTKSASPASVCESSATHGLGNEGEDRGGSGVNERRTGSRSSYEESAIYETYGAPSMSELSYLSSEAFIRMDYPANSGLDQERNYQNLAENFDCNSSYRGSSPIRSNLEQIEVEQLRAELQNTLGMYKRACEELVHAQSKVQLLSSECLEEARRVNAALENEETLRRIAAEEAEKHLKARKEIEEAKLQLAKEAYERKLAESNALKESTGKKEFVDALFSSDNRYRRYSRKEIEIATNFFSEANVIGEGGYGKVYKCSLDHTPVAVKVLRPDTVDKKEEFLKEVEILSQLHHPNIVLLLGACPEIGCLVYEYLQNGNLEDYISHCRSGKPSLPWTVRFRIIFEVACGLAFLHNSKTDPIVHRDLKPGNILLDRNLLSKIGDVGLAKLITDMVPDNITDYRESIIAGTLFYMDPEYQRTGTIRPKSDLFAFGVIILQVLTARHPNKLIYIVENAVADRSLVDILDETVSDWPVNETEELTRLALRCCKLRCRDRPDLETEVLPVLKRLANIAESSSEIDRNNTDAPSHYYCPILQEIMNDPHISADGFTYEYRAIRAWLDKHNVSPVTRLRLDHSELTPNHTLRSAIQEWKSGMSE